MLKILLLHVKRGSEERLVHMNQSLSALNLRFDLVLDGDIDDLTEPILNSYFSGFINFKSAHASCAYKHILCYKQMVREDVDYALILEDDIFFCRNFMKVLKTAIDERCGDKSPWYVGFEATHLKLVPRSQRRKNVVTYKSGTVQCMGAYLINKSAAEAILSTFESQKCDQPIDIYLDKLQKQGLFTLYWSYPPVVEQGSLNGKMNSIIDGTKRSHLKILKRKLTFAYKKILNFFR